MKKLHTAQLALVAVLVLFSGFALAQGDDAEALETVNGVVQQFVEAVNQQDTAGMSQIWITDGQLLEENVGFIEGREAVMEYYAFAPENVGTFELSAEATEAALFGDTAYGLGTYSNVGAEGQVLGDGKWVAIYKQEDGAWKIYRLIGNTNLPLPE